MPFPALVADLVCPVLGAGVVAVPWVRRSNERPGRAWVLAGVAVAWVYVVTYADRRFGWWPAAGLDFSTHTGVALVLALVLGRLERRVRPVLVALLLGYAALLLGLRYHSVLDILTSAAASAPVALVVLRRKWWHPGQDSNLQPSD